MKFIFYFLLLVCLSPVARAQVYSYMWKKTDFPNGSTSATINNISNSGYNLAVTITNTGSWKLHYPQISNAPVSVANALQLKTYWTCHDSSRITLLFTNGAQTVRNVSFRIGDIDKARPKNPAWVDYVTVTGMNGTTSVPPDNLTLKDPTAGYALVNGNEAYGDPTNGKSGNCPNPTKQDLSPTPSDASVNVNFSADINKVSIEFKNPPALWGTTKVVQEITIDSLYFSAGNSILPIQWSDFTGQINGEDVVLNWGTISELNDDHFDVQRSLDGQHFRSIGIIQGMGTSNIPHQYIYRDNVLKISSPVLYYRLNQVNFDGTSSFSKIIAVKMNSSNIRITNIYPNPFIDQVHLQIYFDKSGTAMERLYNPSGIEVYHGQQSVSGGDNNLILGNLAKLPQGMYFMEVRLGNSIYRNELIKQ